MQASKGSIGCAIAFVVRYPVSLGLLDLEPKVTFVFVPVDFLFSDFSTM